MGTTGCSHTPALLIMATRFTQWRSVVWVRLSIFGPVPADCFVSHTVSRSLVCARVCVCSVCDGPLRLCASLSCGSLRPIQTTQRLLIILAILSFRFLSVAQRIPHTTDAHEKTFHFTSLQSFIYYLFFMFCVCKCGYIVHETYAICE